MVRETTGIIAEMTDCIVWLMEDDEFPNKNDITAECSWDKTTNPRTRDTFIYINIRPTTRKGDDCLLYIKHNIWYPYQEI